MQRLSIAPLLLIITATASPASMAQPGASGPNAPAQQVVDRLAKAWNAGDAAAYSALFAPDARSITRSGDLLEGSATIRRYFDELWGGPMKGARWNGKLAHTRPLGPNYLVAEITSEVRGYRALPPRAIESAPGVLRSRGVMVLARQGRDWRIVSNQTTAVAPQPENAARAR